MEETPSRQPNQPTLKEALKPFGVEPYTPPEEDETEQSEEVMDHTRASQRNHWHGVCHHGY